MIIGGGDSSKGGVGVPEGVLVPEKVRVLSRVDRRVHVAMSEPLNTLVIAASVLRCSINAGGSVTGTLDRTWPGAEPVYVTM